ncbi:hypothetical protein BLNAU_21769 [Blattamonas nauphoetae]|uniref:Uncharacterized protein n=1 Tax=Blattamonas nauphoetae TaxID=2049346 RepID=A0ABQ9WUW7_9EUKA|nr:hypothetical protein BLNAU_21769 [Blattamonas nauphoetae]
MSTTDHLLTKSNRRKNLRTQRTKKTYHSQLSQDVSQDFKEYTDHTEDSLLTKMTLNNLYVQRAAATELHNRVNRKSRASIHSIIRLHGLSRLVAILKNTQDLELEAHILAILEIILEQTDAREGFSVEASFKQQMIRLAEPSDDSVSHSILAWKIITSIAKTKSAFALSFLGSALGNCITVTLSYLYSHSDPPYVAIPIAAPSSSEPCSPPAMRRPKSITTSILSPPSSKTPPSSPNGRGIQTAFAFPPLAAPSHVRQSSSPPPSSTIPHHILHSFGDSNTLAEVFCECLQHMALVSGPTLFSLLFPPVSAPKPKQETQKEEEKRPTTPPNIRKGRSDQRLHSTSPPLSPPTTFTKSPPPLPEALPITHLASSSSPRIVTHLFTVFATLAESDPGNTILYSRIPFSVKADGNTIDDRLSFVAQTQAVLHPDDEALQEAVGSFLSSLEGDAIVQKVEGQLDQWEKNRKNKNKREHNVLTLAVLTRALMHRVSTRKFTKPISQTLFVKYNPTTTLYPTIARLFSLHHVGISSDALQAIFRIASVTKTKNVVQETFIVQTVMEQVQPLTVSRANSDFHLRLLRLFSLFMGELRDEVINPSTYSYYQLMIPKLLFSSNVDLQAQIQTLFQVLCPSFMTESVGPVLLSKCGLGHSITLALLDTESLNGLYGIIEPLRHYVHMKNIIRMFEEEGLYEVCEARLPDKWIDEDSWWTGRYSWFLQVEVGVNLTY